MDGSPVNRYALHVALGRVVGSSVFDARTGRGLSYILVRPRTDCRHATRVFFYADSATQIEWAFRATRRSTREQRQEELLFTFMISMTEGHGHTLTGDIQHHAQFASRILKNQRDIWVYLPPGYRRSTSRRYPVFYLHDGQNVFDAATAFGGTEWNADETAQGLINRRLIEPLIIVAVGSAGEDRIHEYHSHQRPA